MYYIYMSRMAIRQHVSDKQSMKRGITSGFCHVASNKNNNLNVNWPTGKIVGADIKELWQVMKLTSLGMVQAC